MKNLFSSSVILSLFPGDFPAADLENHTWWSKAMVYNSEALAFTSSSI